MTSLGNPRLAMLLVTALLLASPSTAPVSAWGAHGHHVVARIAWELMKPAARADAATLLGGDDLFVATALWADEVRTDRPETYNWHFVNIPVGEGKYDAARHCQPSERGDCVIAAIGRARAELADASRPANLRAESLKFLVHFVGDLHQPLHAVDNHDRGGNDVRVHSLRDGPAGRPTNLHAAWDTGMLNLSPTTEAARTTALLAELRARPIDLHTDVVKWAEESREISARVVYAYPQFAATGPPADPVTLSEAYIAAAVKTMDQRLMVAGARLAAVLNEVLGKR